MIRDNLHIKSFDVALNLRIPTNFTYPKDKKNIAAWTTKFSQLSEETTDVDLLRTYNAYKKLFKLAKTKSKLISVEGSKTGEISFVFSFNKFASYAFFIRQIGYFTDNR